MAAGDLTTVDAVKLYARVTSAADDALLTQLVTALSSYAKTWLARSILAADYVQSFHGHGGMFLMLPEYPVNSVASLTIDGITIPARTSALGAGYTFDHESIAVDGYRFTRGRSNVVVSWNGGYATVPADLSQAVNEMVAIVYKEQDRIGQLSKALGNGESVTFFSGDIPPRAKTLLYQFKRWHPC